MSTFNYNRPRNTTKRLTKRYGNPIQITRSVDQTTDIGTGDVTAGVTRKGSFQGAILPITQRRDKLYQEALERGSTHFIIGEAIDMPFEPIPGDNLTIKLKTHEVLGVTTIDVDGQNPVVHMMDILRS